jgi:hypothetical protein
MRGEFHDGYGGDQGGHWVPFGFVDFWSGVPVVSLCSIPGGVALLNHRLMAVNPLGSCLMVHV